MLMLMLIFFNKLTKISIEWMSESSLTTTIVTVKLRKFKTNRSRNLKAAV